MDELISRQAAIDALEWKWAGKAAIDAIKNLPSAQPYTIHSDGRLWVTVDDIDNVRAVVVDEHKSKFCKQFYEDAQPEPKSGQWIDDGSELGCQCSQCGKTLDEYINCGTEYMTLTEIPKFCPNCGERKEIK